MLNLKQLHYFYLTARAGSFARACELANITQPALSNAMKSLEEQIGFSLFDRQDRPISLTPQGRSFFSQVEKLLFQAQNVDSSARYLRHGDEGHVRLGMTAVFAASFGGEASAIWLADNPKMTLDVKVQSTHLLLDKLLAQELDIMVGIKSELQSESGRLDSLDLRPQESLLFCRSGHPLVNTGNVQRSDLERYRLVAGHYAPFVLAQLAARFGFEKLEDLPIVVNSENTELLCDLTANSDLLFLSTYACARHATALGLIRPIETVIETFAHWRIATRKGRLQHPRTQALIDVLKTVTNRGADIRWPSLQP